MSIHLTNAMANYLTLFDFGGPVGKRIAERAIDRNTLYPLSCGDNSESASSRNINSSRVSRPDTPQEMLERVRDSGGATLLYSEIVLLQRGGHMIRGRVYPLVVIPER